jgi:NifU-like protein
MPETGGGRGRLVCRCLGVASFRIFGAARRQRLATVAEVTKATRAGGGCTTCHGEIEEILADVRGEAVDPGLRLENRLVCEAETRARIEGTLGSLIAPRLSERGVSVDGLEIDGLVVRIRLGGAADGAVYRFVAEKLRRYVCRDLLVERLG